MVKKMSQTLEGVRFTSPIEQLRHSMQPLIVHDPLKQFREVVNAVKPQTMFQELSESVRTIQFTSPMEELQKTIDKLQIKSPMQELAERIKTIQTPKTPFEQLEEIIKDTDIRNSIRALFDSVRPSYSISEIYDSIFVDSTALGSFEEAYKDIFTRFIIAESETGDREKAAQETANSVKATVVQHRKVF